MNTFLRIIAFLVFAAASVYAAPDHHWRFDNDFIDSINSGTGSVVGSITFDNGQVGTAGVFNGTSYLDVGSVLNVTSYTKAVWFYRTGGVFNNILSGNGGNPHALFVPEGYNFQLSSGHNGTWDSVRDNVTIPEGQWQHAVVTYDASENGGTMRLYRNGRPVGGKPVATGISPPSGGFVEIGGWDGTAHGFSGRIDDVGIWDRVLSEEEISDLFAEGARGYDIQGETNHAFSVYKQVAEANDYSIVYRYEIPESTTFDSSGTPAYIFDNSSAYGSKLAFDRQAYYLELHKVGAADTQWVFVSFDPITDDASKIGIPTYASGVQFQQILQNMNVTASGSYVTEGTNLTTGNIEFWGLNYDRDNNANIPNASDSVWDAGDKPSLGGYYGCMQIHNHAVNGSANTETIFAYNRWGAGGISDLGFGNRPVGSTDWTFAFNADTYDSRVLYVMTKDVPLPDVSFISAPKSLQLYARDLVTGIATVTIDGVVIETGCTEMTVTTFRNSEVYTNLTITLTGAGNEPFDFAIPIHAELARYDFTVTVTCNGLQYDVLKASNVVAGDSLLVNGQSNAVAIRLSDSANDNQSPWLRSFGTRTESIPGISTDMNWHLAEGDLNQAPGAVGQWALHMGNLLIQSNEIPMCIINGAYGGKAIDYFQRNDSNKEDLSTNYGRLLFRSRQAGIDQDMRAVLWYQGESDRTNAEQHEQGFIALYNDWENDYPALNNVYICQIKNGCSSYDASIELRERQRRLPEKLAKVQVLSTSALQHFTDNCHFPYEEGYRTLGEYFTRLILRDLYGFVMPSQIDAPDFGNAYFADVSKTLIRFASRNTNDVFSVDAGSESDFRVEGVSGAVILSVTASNHYLDIQFDRNVSGASGLTYNGHSGGAPYVKNEQGVGLLYFHNVPILPEPGIIFVIMLVYAMGIRRVKFIRF
ncbi:hypothetical protein KAH27_01220 [bacterium]|nr:hypothetical protein [bacterium]